jgi:hypothetical protein
MADDEVMVVAQSSFGDVRRGDVISVSPERALALGKYVRPLTEVEQDAVMILNVTFGEPEVKFEEESDGEGGHLSAKDELLHAEDSPEEDPESGGPDGSKS